MEGSSKKEKKRESTHGQVWGLWGGGVWIEVEDFMGG